MSSVLNQIGCVVVARVVVGCCAWLSCVLYVEMCSGVLGLFCKGTAE